MTSYLLVAAILIGLVAISAGMMLGMALQKRHQRLVDMEQRITALEAAQPKAHTHKTIAGIEDAQAVVIDLAFQMQADQARLNSLLEILGAVRQGPHSYDPDRPCGRRVEQSERK